MAKDVINNGLPAYTDQQLAGVMFRALGDEYANMRVQIMNAEVLEPGKFPKSTSDVLKLAANWVAPAAKTKGGMDIFISIADEAAADAEEAAAVLLQKAKINEKRKITNQERRLKFRNRIRLQNPKKTVNYHLRIRNPQTSAMFVEILIISCFIVLMLTRRRKQKRRRYIRNSEQNRAMKSPKSFLPAHSLTRL